MNDRMRNFCTCLACANCQQSREFSHHYSCSEGEFTDMGLIDIIDYLGFHIDCEKFKESL
jgi:hypothetical protein